MSVFQVQNETSEFVKVEKPTTFVVIIAPMLIDRIKMLVRTYYYL